MGTINAVAMEDALHCLRTKSDGTARSFADPKQKELNETKRVYSAGPSAGPTLVLKGKSSVSGSFLGVLGWESLTLSGFLISSKIGWRNCFSGTVLTQVLD